MNLSLTRTSLLFDLQFLILTSLARIQQHRRSVPLPGKIFWQPKWVISLFLIMCLSAILLLGVKERSWFLLCCSNNTVDRRPLSPASLSKCENLLMRLAQFYKYHGINIKTCYADFDKHHIGVVTESQVGTNNYYQFVDPALKIQNPLLKHSFFSFTVLQKFSWFTWCDSWRDSFIGKEVPWPHQAWAL